MTLPTTARALCRSSGRNRLLRQPLGVQPRERWAHCRPCVLKLNDDLRERERKRLIFVVSAVSRCPKADVHLPRSGAAAPRTWPKIKKRTSAGVLAERQGAP